MSARDAASPPMVISGKGASRKAVGRKWLLASALTLIGLVVVNGVAVGMSFAETASTTTKIVVTAFVAAFFARLIWRVVTQAS